MTRRADTAAVRLAAVLLAFGPLAAPCDAEWQLTPFAGFTFKGDTTVFAENVAGDDDIESVNAANRVHWNFGGAATLIGAGPIGVEGLFLFTPGFLQQDLGLIKWSRTTALMGNVVLATPRGWNEYGLRPYVSGGLGLLRLTAEDVQGVQFEQPVNMLGYNVGGGAVGFLTDRIGLRFDLRYFSHVRPDPELVGDSVDRVELKYWNTAVGVVFRY